MEFPPRLPVVRIEADLTVVGPRFRFADEPIGPSDQT